MSIASIAHQEPFSGLTSHEALKIAQADASNAYGDLSMYQITIVRSNDRWQIDYNLLGHAVAGGGPHYIIDAITGQIVHKRYEQ